VDEPPPLASEAGGGVAASGGASWKVLGTASSRLVILIVGGLTSVVISRALRPEGRGSYYVVVTVATTAMTLGHLSIEQAQTYLWARGADRRALAGNAVALGTGNGLIAAAVAWGAVQLAGQARLPVAGGWVLPVALVGVPTGIAVLYTGQLLLLADRIGRYNTGKLVSAVMQCGLLLGLVAADRLTVGAVVACWVIGLALPLVFYVPEVRPRAVSMPLAREALRVGARYHAGMAALFLLWRVDVFLLNAQVSKAQIGLYSLAVTLAEMTYQLTDSVALSVLPRQVELAMDESARFTARVVRTNFVLSALAIVVLVVVSPVVIPLVFGTAYRGAVRPLMLLAPGIVALTASRTIQPYLVRLNRPWLASGLTVGALVVNVVLNLVLIPDFGIKGASLASTLAYAGLGLSGIVWLVRSSVIGWADLVPRAQDFREPLATLSRRLTSGGR
jgi:O-antigen/teichoic acid export membrane protein